MANLSRPAATLILVLATAIWGFAFLAQKSAMDHVGPFTFIAVRYLVGILAILPLALSDLKKAKAPLSGRQWLKLLLLGLFFWAGSVCQQMGLLTTSVTNAGFLTGLYVFFVPLILWSFFGVRPHPMLWICAALALGGLFLLSGARLDGFGYGDWLVMAGAVFWAGHVLMLSHMSRETGMPVFVTLTSFVVAGSLGAVGAFGFETPEIGNIAGAWIEIAYAGVLSTALAFSLQAIGQVHVPPSNAAIILSGESLFAAIGAALILGERLPPAGYAGALLLFSSIILVEAFPMVSRPVAAPSALPITEGPPPED